MAPVSFVRRMHLSMSHWAFVLMRLHLGMHIPWVAAGLKLKDRSKAVLACVFTCNGGIGLWLFLRNGTPNYLFFRVPFAFLDYEKAGWLVFLENVLMLFSQLVPGFGYRFCAEMQDDQGGLYENHDIDGKTEPERFDRNPGRKL